jgi:hypothetical protein
MKDGYLFVGALVDATDVLERVNFKEVGRSQQEQPGTRLGKFKLERRLGDGHVDVFGLAVGGSHFDCGIILEGNEFFR